ncbi:CubicO group peptidase (beta-lactamase class C family) [Nonomuraea thailandensis]|uniref:CubicO group peptidase (Beta-lactamase class C family) n=1 Tax=Nonomuraea thailandensis TaxID=1188745 RepID=A0A9X2GHG7_9ACTN|nr:serine hydrolase domain-containing protein [Nonomuraea thailandensis]MCP2357725.1 CubicO group peptidase (beta-lactamase class C family) [Nonomuraea thailandensis]
MTGHEPRPSRRTALGLLGAVPLTASGAPAASAATTAATTAATAGTAGTAAAAGSGRIPADLRPGGAFDRYIRDLAERDQFSGTVLLAHRGRHVLARAYGMADKDRRIPNEIDTIYAMASASKPFTGLAVVQLAQQRKIRFHDTVGDHLDGFPAEIAEHVTVHQMLTHTSGMTDPTNDAPAPHVFTSVEERNRDIAARARSQTLRFTPGTRKEYSSMGYEVLGELVAAVSGQPFHEYVREHVFERAGMADSAYRTRTEWLADERIAHPYMLQEDGSRADGVRHLDKGGIGGVKGSNSARAFIGSGGGNGFTTAPDLVRFALALQRDELLKRAYTELYVNAKVSGPPLRQGGPVDPRRGEAFHAYGPTASIYNDRRYVSHGGGIAGGSTNWSIYLDLDWVAVVLCNYDLQIEPIIEAERSRITA